MRNRKFTAGLVAGALIGAAAAIVVAPTPGKETRGLIRDKTDKYVIALRDKFKRNREFTNTHA